MNDQNGPAAAAPPLARTPDLDAVRRRGLFARVAARMRAKGEMILPSAPSLVGHFVDVLADQFAALGRPFSAPELDVLHRNLHDKLCEAFAVSATSTVFVKYHTVGDGSLRIEYGIAADTSTVAEQYAHWVETREPPLFGQHADARVLAAAASLPAGAACLDVGAGTGRNSLGLARLGLSVDAVEPVPALAAVIEAEAARESLALRVVQADVVSGPLPLDKGRYALVVASQVTSHFRSAAELRALFRAFATALAPGAQALVTLFLTRADYHPDRIAREMGQVFWTTFYTPEELATALAGLPLTTLSSEDALTYEREHQSPENWPPTSWFEGWALGEDVFGHQPSPPITLRWLTLRRTPGPVPAD